MVDRSILLGRSAARGRPRCFSLLAAGLLLGCLALPLVGGVPEGWSTNLTAALETAQQERRPVLVYFTAEWCGPCRAMQRTTLKDEGVGQELENFLRVALEIDNHKETAGEYGVSAVPTFVLLDSAGDELDRSSGLMEANLFQAWLVSGRDKHLVALQRQAKFLEQQKKLLADLQGPDPAAKNVALATLFDLCARREQSHARFALAELKALAEREPARLLDGLNHASLATRIHLTNLLREKWGAAFEFDPWEKPEVRSAALTDIRQRFGTKP